MASNQKKPESVERIICKDDDDVAVSIAPSPEQAEECLKVLSAVESRIANSGAMTEDSRQDAIAAIGNLRKFFSEKKSKE